MLSGGEAGCARRALVILHIGAGCVEVRGQGKRASKRVSEKSTGFSLIKCWRLKDCAVAKQMHGDDSYKRSRSRRFVAVHMFPLSHCQHSD
jgi:hypothetical protein